MDNRQRHEMISEQNHPSGAQTWYCPTCGQCLLVTWIPRFMTIIRNAGNKSALHIVGNHQQHGSGPLNPADRVRHHIRADHVTLPDVSTNLQAPAGIDR